MPVRAALLLSFCIFAAPAFPQDLSGFQFHGFVTQGFLFSSHNNYLTMQSSSGSLQWTDGAVSVSDSISDSLRVGIQLHMYQLGQLGGPNVQVDWALGDYKVNDYFGVRAGKVKTVIGLFNDSQDVDAIFLWILLPQSAYPLDNKGFYLSHLGGEMYGGLPLGSHAGSLLYRGYAGEATMDLTGGYVKELTDAGLVFTTPPGGKTYGGDVRWQAPLAGLTLGSSANVKTLNGTGLFDGVPGSLKAPNFLTNAQYAQFQKGKYYVAGEYRRTPIVTILSIGPQVFSTPIDMRIWYAMASYRVSKKFQVGTYYSHYVDKAANTTQPGNYSKDWALSGRYDFNSYFYAKLESHFLHGTALGYYESTNSNGLQPNSTMLAAKIGFSF
jgi:hypothetical protein